MRYLSLALFCTSLTSSVFGQGFTFDHKLEGDLADVIAATAANDLIHITIAMADQVTKAELSEASSIGDKVERRATVTAMLQARAQGSQGPLLEYLQAREAAGQARDVRPLWIANVIAAQVTPAVALEISALSEVAYVHYDRQLTGEQLASSPAASAAAAGDVYTCGLRRVRAPEVWNDLGVTGAGIVVGVIDTGICKSHPDIVNQLWVNPCEIPGNNIDDDLNGYVDDIDGWNFESNNANVNDSNGHGSHVSGTVAGDGASGRRSGVAPDAQIMTLKFWNNASGEASVWEAEQYAVVTGADITTASLGWSHGAGPDRVMWRMVIENTIAAGVVVLYAAGNEGFGSAPDNVRTPGDVPDVITVGATRCTDEIAGFSSRGPVTWQGIQPYDDHPFPPGLLKPDVSAPGASTNSHNLCSGYALNSGTSMATPHVAGLAALILQADPSLDHFGVKAILESTSVDLGPAGKDNRWGSGRIDCLMAVTDALANGNGSGFCPPKLNSCGSLPIISASGVPSVTATSGYSISANNMAAGAVALLVYTDQGRSQTPLLGGTLCLTTIRRAVPVIDSIGSPGNCDGVVTMDMNAYASGAMGGSPAGFLTVPGTTVDCQYWARDANNSFGALLTGSVTYTICP